MKAQWPPPVHRHFLDLCVEETMKGNRRGSTFNKEGWRNILESLNKKPGFSIDRRQLKNHWDSTRLKWKAWSKLIGTDFMKWDATAGQFGASEEEWATYIRANPDAVTLRYDELEHREKLEIMFSRITGSRECDISEPPSKRRKDDNDISVVKDEDDEQQNLDLERIEPLSEDIESERQHQQLERTKHQFNGVESRSPVTVHSSRAYSIGECIESLDGILEVEQGSDLYLFALDIFLNKEYREIFLQLKKPSVKIAWLKRLQLRSHV